MTDTLSGHEPGLSQRDAARDPAFTGNEPMLGGIHRVNIDTRRIDTLINSSDERQRRQVLDMIRRFGEEERYSAELTQIIPARARQKIDNWRGTFTPSQRIRAMEAIAIIGGPECILPLLDLLGEQNHAIRSTAEVTVIAVCARLDPAQRDTSNAYRQMTRALEHLPLSGRAVVAHLLASAPPDIALRTLIYDGLQSDSWHARREAARALGMLGDIRATKGLIDTLRDPVSSVRASAAWALGQLDAPPALGALREAALDEDEVVRAAAIEAVGAHALRTPSDTEPFETALGVIAGGLEDPDIAVRHAALQALNGIEVPQARIALHAFLNRSRIHG